MQIKRIGATITAALALVAGGALVNAAPAAAVGGCPSGKLCLYRSTEYRTMSFEAASTSACFDLDDYGLTYPSNGINSYVNNLPVKATLYHSEPTGWFAMSTIRSGGFSSNTGALTSDGHWYRYSEKICTGSATP
ncbi:MULTISPECIES: peptidase inhibitor family I36 protein [unclassified Streptomyces]|uniref:peptidase inhibitor family I36 protein n=1 Tax=Streptomyces sp. NPDC127129 TaxID=3345373 RepID=UPI003626FDF4